MENIYNGMGGSFTIDPVNGEVKPTIDVADEKKIAYSPINDDKLTGESENGAAN